MHKTLLLLLIFTLIPIVMNSQEYHFKHSLYEIKNSDGSVSYQNYRGHIVSKYKYQHYEYGNGFSNGFGYKIVKRNGLYGAINIEGVEIIPCIYLDWEYSHDKENEKSYLIMMSRTTSVFYNNLGEKLFQLETLFTDAESNICFNQQIWLRNAQNKWGAINLVGNTVIPFTYDGCEGHELNKESICVEKKGSYGLIDVTGKVIIPFIIKDYEIEGEEDVYLICEDKNEKLFSISTDFNVIKLGGPYEEYGGMYDRRIAVKENGLWGFLDLDGKQLTEYKYTSVNDFSEEMAIVCNADGRYACINSKGKEVSEFKYKYISDFHDGIAVVCDIVNSKYGAINKLGHEIIPCVYDQINAPLYTTSYLIAKENDAYGCVDSKDGTVILPFQFRENDINYYYGSIVRIRKNGKWGLIDIHKNEMLRPFMYDKITELGASGLSEELSDVFISGKRGALNKEGVEVVPCTDKEIEFLVNIEEYLSTISSSDVDVNIPNNKDQIRENTFAVIIANEKYSEMSIADVPYANKDGAMFKEYCCKTLGIPSTNIKYRENATLNQIRYELNWLKDIAEAYNGHAKIIFYYAGHGIPNESNSTSYILPSDGFGSDVKSAYSLNELYAQLGELPAKQVTVFMDACFSGAKRDGKMLTSARGVAIRSKSGTPQGNMVVFSAAQGDETAYQYNKKKHGMFTYFLLKKLQETKGKVTLEELGNYLKQQVQRTSMKENNKLQTPTMQVSPDLKKTLKSIHL